MKIAAALLQTVVNGVVAKIDVEQGVDWGILLDEIHAVCQCTFLFNPRIPSTAY
jgi:hypothetical protein